MKGVCRADFDAVADRWDAFWRGENRRPMVMAVLPKAGVEPVSKPPYASGADGQFGPAIDQLLRWEETHDFLGDALPFYYLEFGADHFASLLGADLTFRDNEPGGWAVPFVEDLDAVDLRFRREGKWWQRTVAFAEALRARSEGRVLLAAPTLVATVDALAAVRGPERLLLDMVDNPAAVHRALAQITRAHGEILEALAGLLDFRTFGSINRHGCYGRGRINLPQCDFSCMISPEMFGEFVVPCLREEMRRFDGVEYHLDGPDALRHLEALCGLEDLDVIQWVPGAGNGEQQDWSWLHQRIDGLGKGQIRYGNACELQRIQQTCRDRRQVFGLWAPSRAEAEESLAAWPAYPAGS